MYDDYYEPSEYDEQVEEFKNTLRESVKQETRDELARLRAENAEMRSKLIDLDRLTREAESAKKLYERDLDGARKSALVEVRRESAVELLKVLSEPVYTIRSTQKYFDKCDQCDDDRYLHYKSPRGKNEKERCECADEQYAHYYLEERIAWSAAHRNRELLVWYTPIYKLEDDPQWGTSTVKNPDGVSLARLVENYDDYGYTSKEAAQEVADALNAGKTKEDGDSW